MNSKNSTLQIILLFATLHAFAQQVPNVKNSWFGNSTPLTATFTPQGMDDMCVGKDGTCYTNVPWEEGGANFAEFKNGNVNHGDASHGWGAGGGMAAASNLNYVYWSMVMGNEGGGLVGSGAQIDRWPVGSSKTWIGVTRRQKSDVKQGAAFSGGKGWPLNSMLMVEELDNNINYGGDVNITGLYANETELFVSIELFNKVKVYDATTMAFKREFAVPQPRQLAMDSWGKLWVAQGFDATIINRYDPTNGVLLPEAINLPSGSFVGDFCIDRNDRMLIGDVGRREQVLIYTTINTYPRETSTFGALYGIHSGVSGRNAPLKFQQIRGIGTDDNDNIYVGNTQWHTGGQGTMVEKYNAAGVLQWKNHCVLFVDACGLDAQTNGDDAYGKVEHFEIDYSKPLGQETEYVAYTIDRYKYPADPRLWQSMANVQAINFKGKKFLVMMDMTGRLIALFRFNKATDGEIAIPCIVWGERVNKNYPGSIDKQWVWRDTDGDGQMEAGEYTQQDTYFIDGGRGTYFDTNGDIWQAGWENLLVNKCLGLDANGIPFYNGSRTAIPAPAPLWDVKRAYYDPALDRMYISGRSTNDPSNGQFDWMTMGRYIYRYDNWSTGNRVAQSELSLPFSNNGGIADPISFSVVKDYIFVCFVGGDNVIPRQQINIYRVSDNSFVGFIRPYWGGEGLFDMNQSINVQFRKNGEYVIVAEENGRNKNILYRWCPDGTCVETPNIVKANNNYIGFPHFLSTNVLSVTSNVNWTFTGIPSWLTLNTLTGNGNKIINFTASANLGPSRSAVITLTGGGVLWNEITVFQLVDDLAAPTNVTTVFGTFIDVDQFILNWTESTDNVMVAGYEVYKDNVYIKSVPGLNTVINGLNPSTDYNMKVIAFDERGNKLAGTTKIIRTKNITYPYITSKDHANFDIDDRAFDGNNNTFWKDWEIQSWIQIQYATPQVWNKYTIWNLQTGQWFFDDDPRDWTLQGSNDGVTYISLSTQANQFWSARGTSKEYYFTNTTGYNRYRFVISGVRGGRSVGIAEIIFANAPLIDTEPPTVPTALSSSQITPTTANLSWLPSTDNVAVFGYEIFRNGVPIGSSTGTNFAVTGLTPSTAYSFTVRAYDITGNLSGQSAPTAFTTRTAPTLSININNFNFIAAGGSQSISVTSNGIWTVSGLPSWLVANPATDFGNATTSIVATVNPNLGARSCVITISSWAAMAFVTITQDGTLPTLMVNPTNLTYLSGASSQTLSITSNINWTVSGLPTWLSLNTSTGFGNRNISLSTQLHSVAGIRTAQVTITGGALTQFVNITQTGAAASLVANPLTLTYPSAGNSQNISVTSNMSWTSVSSEPWLSLTNPNGTNDGIISATTTANTATGIRTAQVTISGASLTQIVNITQTGANPNVNVNASTVNFTAAGGVQFVTISSNSNWNVSGIPAWMTVNPSSGVGNFVITLTAPINLNVNTLNEILTVTSGLSNVEINVNQAGATPILVVNPINLTYISIGNTESITVTSNINWTLTGLPNWMIANPMNEFGKRIISASVNDNTSTGIRMAQLTVSGGAISRIINITQSGANPILIANTLTLTYPSAGNSQNISVTSNMSWTSISSQPWLILSNQNGTNDGIISASASFNLSTNSRIANVTITSLNPVVNQIITITQTGSMPAPILSINKDNITNCGGRGSITLTGNGGALPYEFSLDNFVTTSTSANASFVFSNLAAGTYTGYIRNSASPFYGSSISGIIITTPVLPNIVTITALDISNCGLVDGSINVVANGGTGILEYFIDNSWTTNANATGLTAGLYQILVRNQNSPACSVSGIGNVNIAQPDTPKNLTVNQINSIQSCDGSLGSIVLSATFGVQADLRFSLDGIDYTNATGTFTGLAAGSNYKASVRNVNAISCSLAGNNFNTITTPSFPIINSVTKTDITDCGLTNGAVTISGTGGTGNLEYSINNIDWQNANIFSNLSTLLGFPKVRNVSSQNCVVTFTGFTITTPSFPSISSVTKTDITDCGLTNGAVTISGTGGTGNLEYSINNIDWQNTNTFTNLSTLSGFPKVRNVLSQNCVVTFTGFTITTPSFPNITSVTKTDITDCGLTNGAVTILGTGGTGNLEYSINNIDWQNANIFSNLSTISGFPKVRNVLSQNCVVTFTGFTITTPSYPNILATNKTDITNCGFTNGAITISGTGGTGNLEYSINNINWQNANIFSNLSTISGFPKVRNVSSQNCVVTFTGFTITTPSFPNITLVTKTDITDCGLTNGAVTISGTGGTGNLEYSIDNTNWQNANIFSNLSTISGFPKVRNVSSQNCLATFTGFTITTPSLPILQNSSDKEICAGKNTILTVSGAASFSWLPLAGLNVTAGNTVTANPIISTNYTVAGLQGNCTVKKVILVTVNELPNVTLTGPSEVCQEESVSFEANGANSYEWIPTTTTGNTFTISTLNVGNFVYSVVGTNPITGCKNTVSKPILVKLKPNAPSNANTTPMNICVGETMVFTEPILNANESAQWYNETSNQLGSMPTILTNVAGKKIALVSKLLNGCESGKATISGEVFAKPNVPNFKYLKNQFCSYEPAPIQRTDIVATSGISFSTNATVSNGFLDSENGFINISNANGQSPITIVMSVSGNAGCASTTTSQLITITEFKNTPILEYSSNVYCKEAGVSIAPTNLNLYSISGGSFSSSNISFNQTNGVGDISTANVGIHTVRFTYPSYGGCVGGVVESQPITIVSAIAGNITTPKDKVCQGESVTLISTGHYGNVRWAYSNDTQKESNLGSIITTSGINEITREYQAFVSLAGCRIEVVSNKLTITGDKPTTFSGLTATLAEICSETSTDLNFAEVTADKFDWFMSDDNATFKQISNLEAAQPHSSSLLTPKIELYEYGKVRYYYAKIKNGNCNTVETPVIKVEKCKIGKYTPNALSPIASGENAYWDLTDLRLLKQSKVTIYNRYGIEVYSVDGETATNIKFDGIGLPAGTYYYVIQRNDGSKTKDLIGDLTIVK